MIAKRLIAVIILGLVILTAYTNVFSAADKKQRDDLFRQVSLFSDTLAIIQTEYVDQTKPRDLIYGALKGMLAALDPHSQFMDPETYNELKVDTEGRFGGLGIEITIRDGLLTIVTPIEDTPAWKAGLKAGDRIVKINNELTRDMTLLDAVKKLRGKPQEVVNITVLRESQNKLIDFKIPRDIIKIEDIKEARILEDGIGYIRLIEFRENTAQDLDEVLRKLGKEKMRALILDLRNNPGGLLESAVKITEKFIEKGKLIVAIKGRKRSQDTDFIARVNSPILDLPMVVLINEGSASGSEILAACLKDYKRAIIVGMKSFGKGSVQTVIPLSDGSALRLTTAKYFSPSGKQIHGKGVVPDIEVEEVKAPSSDSKEAESQNSDGIFKRINQKKSKLFRLPVDRESQDYQSDNQLRRALDALKAIRIYEEKT
jgi:carboxyl-terminal processing protease